LLAGAGGDILRGMPQVHFTSHLQRFVDCDAIQVAGATAGDALRAALEGRDQLRGYVLDDQGRLRRHVMLFVDGQVVRDRSGLTDPVRADAEIYVMQALSGG